jgi:large subunit ribosomal protein L24
VAVTKQKPTKIKIKRGDKVVIIAGKDKDKKGKVLLVDRKNNRLIVEGCNMVTKHAKARSQGDQGGIVKKEAPLHASNVMYLHKDKPTRIGYKLETKEIDGKTVTIKKRVAKTTGEVID